MVVHDKTKDESITFMLCLEKKKEDLKYSKPMFVLPQETQISIWSPFKGTPYGFLYRSTEQQPAMRQNFKQSHLQQPAMRQNFKQSHLQQPAMRQNFKQSHLHTCWPQPLQWSLSSLSHTCTHMRVQTHTCTHSLHTHS